MRSAPTPARYFTTCPTCGRVVSAAIRVGDRTCPDARGTVTVHLVADATAFDRTPLVMVGDGLAALPDFVERAVANAEAILNVALSGWQRQVMGAALVPNQQIAIVHPGRSGRTVALEAAPSAFNIQEPTDA